MPMIIHYYYRASLNWSSETAQDQYYFLVKYVKGISFQKITK